MLNNFNRIFAMSTRKYNENSLYQSLIQEKMLNFLYYYNNLKPYFLFLLLAFLLLFP